MAAGQLGGTLYPTREVTNSARDLAINASFGAAMQAWNKHDYKDTVAMLKAHIARYPDSPWAAEAALHVGCDALYHGRYNEADRTFKSIINANQGNLHPGAQKLALKARLRLANLRTAQGNFLEAIDHYAIVKKFSPDWRQRAYASAWIRQLSLERHDQEAIVNCGVQALAQLLEKSGKKAEAQKVRRLMATSPRGQSMQGLKAIAAGYGFRLTGLRLSAAQLKKIPLPAIVQLGGSNQDDLGHYWVLERRTNDTLSFYDLQSRRRFDQTFAELSREWEGHALVLAGKQKLAGTILAA